MMRERLKAAFIGPGGVRALWRIALFAAFWYLSERLLFPVVARFYTFSPGGFAPLDILVVDTVDALYLLAVSVLLVRLERHRTSWFGLGLGRGTLRLFGAGCLYAFGMLTLLLAICWACGYVRVTGLGEHGTQLWKYGALWLAAMLAVGLSEELQYRGYALASLTRGLGFWPAALLTSLVFVWDHMSKPMETVPDLLNIGLLGLLVCYSVRLTGSLWFAIGFHAAFDFLALGFYGSPNTGNAGMPLPHHLLATEIAGPAWLTGGPQGLEASLLMPPLILGTAWLLRRRYRGVRYPHD